MQRPVRYLGRGPLFGCIGGPLNTLPNTYVDLTQIAAAEAGGSRRQGST
jgi:hypothetical protein